MIPNGKYTVLVNCMTYNQSNYIIDALNGFVSQQTTFPYICIVMDDASTDGEDDVIRRWITLECDLNKAEYIQLEEGEVIIIPHIGNPNCVFACYFLKYNLFKEQWKKEQLLAPWRSVCPYEAFCEGDDYWIDPQKLQSQVDILNTHKEISLVHTGFRTVDEKKNDLQLGYFERVKNLGESGNMFFKLMRENHIMTLTTCMRTSVLNSRLFKEAPYLDYSISLTAASMGDIFYLPCQTACYRQAPNSLVHTRLSFVSRRSREIKLYFYKKIISGEIKGRMTMSQKIKIDIIVFDELKGFSYEERKAHIKEILNICPLKILVYPLSPIMHLIWRIRMAANYMTSY